MGAICGCDFANEFREFDALAPQIFAFANNLNANPIIRARDLEIQFRVFLHLLDHFFRGLESTWFRAYPRTEKSVYISRFSRVCCVQKDENSIRRLWLRPIARDPTLDFGSQVLLRAAV